MRTEDTTWINFQAAHMCVESERGREMDLSLSPPLPLKEKFSIYQKLCDLLDLREKVDKSDTNSS